VKPHLKFADGVQWVRIPPGKGLPPTGSESCQCRETESGSVDSECRSRVNEPRKGYIAVAFVVEIAGAIPPCCDGMAQEARPGSESRAEVREDSPGTWEARTAPPRESGLWVTIGREPETSRPALIPPSWSWAGDTNKEGGRWYRQTEATKCGGKAAGRLSTAIVPMRTANPTRGEPQEERAVSGVWGRCWETRRV
jgi:hypothetical protein